MASVMAIGSEVFGSCVGEINVSVEKKESRCLALLLVELFGIYFDRKCGSMSALVVDDVARYWKAIRTKAI